MNLKMLLSLVYSDNKFHLTLFDVMKCITLHSLEIDTINEQKAEKMDINKIEISKIDPTDILIYGRNYI
jgi:hypothetical protein